MGSTTTTAPPDIDALIAELLDVQRQALAELQAIRRALEAHDDRGLDERHVALLAALAHVMRDLDLEFTSDEVITAAQTDHGLGEALDALQARDAQSLGNVFRDLRDRPCGGFILRRSGRAWLLRRTSV